MISSVFDSGIKGLSKSLQSAEQTANDIARATGVNSESATAATSDEQLTFVAGDNAETNLSSSLVELKLYEQSFAASAKVVSVSDDLLGTLLDTTA